MRKGVIEEIGWIPRILITFLLLMMFYAASLGLMSDIGLQVEDESNNYKSHGLALRIVGTAGEEKSKLNLMSSLTPVSSQGCSLPQPGMPEKYLVTVTEPGKAGTECLRIGSNDLDYHPYLSPRSLSDIEQYQHTEPENVDRIYMLEVHKVEQ